MSENTKRLYEAMFLVDSADATADWDGIMATIDNLMQRAGADLESARKWDERRLCFEVDGRRRGTYVLCYFRATPDAIVGLERDIQLNEQILRGLILNGENLSEQDMQAATPAMQAAAEAEEAERATQSAASEAPASEAPAATATVVATPPVPAEGQAKEGAAKSE